MNTNTDHEHRDQPNESAVQCLSPAKIRIIDEGPNVRTSQPTPAKKEQDQQAEADAEVKGLIRPNSSSLKNAKMNANTAIRLANVREKNEPSGKNHRRNAVAVPADRTIPRKKELMLPATECDKSNEGEGDGKQHASRLGKPWHLGIPDVLTGICLTALMVRAGRIGLIGFVRGTEIPRETSSSSTADGL
jgi:hypothetical protein